MTKSNLFWLLATLFLATASIAEAQQPKSYRGGVLVPGEAWYEILEGLRVGLKQVGFEEGKQYALSIRDWKGDGKVAEEAAKKFEQEKVNLILRDFHQQHDSRQASDDRCSHRILCRDRPRSSWTRR